MAMQKISTPNAPAPGGHYSQATVHNGLVFVASATSPVLVRVNFDNARFNGVEFNTEARFNREFSASGNFTSSETRSPDA